MVQRISEQPIEQDLAQTIVSDVLPKLRALYKQMAGIQVEWSTPEFQEVLTASGTGDTPLAGLPFAHWQELGGTLLKLQAWMDTPDADLSGKSPKEILFRRYVAQ